MSSILLSIKRGKVLKIFVEDLHKACPGDKSKPPFQRIKMDIENDSVEEGNEHKNKQLPVYCSIPFCDEKSEKNRLCDFKLFVSWLGSDKNHKKLISTSERFMVFENYNIEELFKSVLDIAYPFSDKDTENKKYNAEVKEDEEQYKDLEDSVVKQLTKTQKVEFERIDKLTEI